LQLNKKLMLSEAHKKQIFREKYSDIVLSCAFLLLLQPVQAQNAVSTAASTSISTKAKSSMMLYPAIQQYLQSVSSEFNQISAERKEVLAEMAAFVRAKNQAGEAAALTFICTHNSRRSHMAQLWAAAAVDFYGVKPGIESYSGGTEVTAFNPRAVKAMREAGFDISAEGSENPTYTVKWTENQLGSACFSKHYAHPSNPQSGFGAVMTCSDADEACPIVFGAEDRFSLPYRDPKEADNTPEEAARYTERCRQIAREMLYMASLL
jgi:hypothetical protein